MRPISLFHAHGDDATEAAALTVLRSGQIAAGPKVAEFEQALAGQTGLPHVVTTNDMSSAMMLALHLLGVGSGDEVLTPAYTCMSSAAPISNLGARPRWVDVDAATGLMDPAALRAQIKPTTRACVVYHAAGYPAPSPALADICREHGVAFIEDCNNAFGARLEGRAVGSWGDAAIFSFYPNRQINAAEGGAVAFRDARHAAAALQLRRFGIATSGFRDATGEISAASDIPAVGWSAAMSQLHAAMGLAQLPGLGERLARTQAHAYALAQRLVGLPGLQVVTPGEGAEPVYWGLLVLCEHRDTVLAALKSQGVMASKLHHHLDSYTGFGSEPAALPGTAEFMRSVIALPCGHWLSGDDLERVAHAVRQAVKAARSGA